MSTTLEELANAVQAYERALYAWQNTAKESSERRDAAHYTMFVARQCMFDLARFVPQSRTRDLYR